MVRLSTLAETETLLPAVMLGLGIDAVRTSGDTASVVPVRMLNACNEAVSVNGSGETLTPVVVAAAAAGTDTVSVRGEAETLTFPLAEIVAEGKDVVAESTEAARVTPALIAGVGIVLAATKAVGFTVTSAPAVIPGL